MTDADIDRLVASIKARAALMGHECKEHPAWCPGHDIGCSEAAKLSRQDDEAFGEALRIVAELEKSA